MGNMQCPAEDAAHLAAVARVICPFPNYTPSPYFSTMLNINSSRHLNDHYTAVQNSLTPKQLEDFTQDLKTTFGRKGKVTNGGSGVVAFSLAVLFDTLAKTVKGEWVSDHEPIPGLFLKNPRGYYPPQVYTISKYLRLVPHIANSPTRMKQETARIIKQFQADFQVLKQTGDTQTIPMNEDVTIINFVLVHNFLLSLHIHLSRIDNSYTDDMIKFINNRETSHEFGNDSILNVNCDPEKLNCEFLAEVERSDIKTKEAFQKCAPKENIIGPKLKNPNAWLLYVAELSFFDAVFFNFPPWTPTAAKDLAAQKEDFDLKANALGRWE